MNGRIAALAGRVPELTAEQLDGMDAAALAALYSSGVRLLMVKNNETITLHSIDSAGALTWLDTNMPRENLLINSNFRIAQAGYGGMHGSYKYAADRWMLYVHDGGNISATMDSQGILHVTAEDQDGSLSQRFLSLDNTKTYTAAFYMADGTLEFAYINNAGDVSYVQSGILSGQTRMYSGAVLYEGTYNAITMPPFIPPDPTVELTRCMTCYEKTKKESSGYLPCAFLGTGIRNYFICLYKWKVRKRTGNPEIRINGASAGQEVVMRNTFTNTITSGTLELWDERCPDGLGFIQLNGATENVCGALYEATIEAIDDII